MNPMQRLGKKANAPSLFCKGQDTDRLNGKTSGCASRGGEGYSSLPESIAERITVLW